MSFFSKIQKVSIFFYLMKSWRSLIYSSITLQTCLFSQLSASVENYNNQEIHQFLTLIANSEQEEWQLLSQEILNFSTFPKEFSTGKFLSQLKDPILKSDDLDLIYLYNRAVKNFNSLSSEKSDPVPTYYKHYQTPDFFVPKIELILDVADKHVSVTTELTVQRNCSKDTLILDGEDHQVSDVAINGITLEKSQYKVTLHELIIFNIPKEELFLVEIKSKINPFINKMMEGLYQCGEWLTTQCESEGARRIFFTVDRPDVLSSITTTIVADPEKYPYRLSNGNLIDERQVEEGRISITWQDPFPKPCYLFACVLGRFSVLKSDFVTRSGKEVELEIYVEEGKESRAEYGLFILKKAMEFDEVMFDREYDLASLKMVGIPDFNSGAMENKGLMIFNDTRLLVDSQSGTDRSYRDIAHVIAHEYFHNWSGNRVTVRNWFEIALKEAFTDLRAMLFSEWLFGSEFIRPKAVQTLKEFQFPEEISERGHPLIVESYVDAHSIYDNTTYIKGREVFRTLKNYIDLLIPDGFREVQNIYFSRYDGQAVTFRELLASGNEVLKTIGKDLQQFERWFHQPGTPEVKALLSYDQDQKLAILTLIQSCQHPQTKEFQKPFQIPFSVELVGEDGKVLHPKLYCVLEEARTTLELPSSELPTPIFMHSYSAPITLAYEYSLEDLAKIVKFSDDVYCRWDAAQKYFILAFKEMQRRINEDSSLEERAKKGELVFNDLFALYQEVVVNKRISPLAKAQILEMPSLRFLSQSLGQFDFERLGDLRLLFIRQLASVIKSSLEDILVKHPSPIKYEPLAEQMQIRELRFISLSLLALIDLRYNDLIFQQYQSATNFEDSLSAFHLCVNHGGEYKDLVTKDFYEKWNKDKAIFNFWLSSQASTSQCTVEDLKKLEKVEGYDSKNPNHIRSIFRTFIGNLRSYHSSNGDGYEFIVDKIVEVSKFNPFIAHSHLAVPAFLDFDRLPAHQKALMAKALNRLRLEDVPAQTRDLVEKILQRYTSL